MSDTLNLPLTELLSAIKIKKQVGSLYKPNLKTLFSRSACFIIDEKCKSVKRIIRIRDRKATHFFTFMSNNKELIVSCGSSNCTLIFESKEHLEMLLYKMRWPNLLRIEEIKGEKIYHVDLKSA